MIDWFSQDDISKKRVAVVGAGATGNEVIKNLALLGVGYIKIFDIDTIEIHNLTRSILFRESDVGRSKASVAASRARKITPSITIEESLGDVWTQLTIESLITYDVLICCVDNFETRLKLNQMCLMAGVDMVNTAIDSKFIVVETFNFEKNLNSACYECNLPHSAYTRMGERYSCGSLKKTAYIEKKVPTTIITSSIAGAFATSNALRLGEATSYQNDKRILIDSITGSTTITELTKNPDCPACAAHPRRPILLSAKRDISSLISFCNGTSDNIENLTLILSDPVIASYECISCGSASSDSEFLLRLSSDFDDSISVCKHCNQDSVRIDIKDQFTVKELVEKYAGILLPCKYITATVENTKFCIELEGATT
jgi:molybdopterin-synthase adenylyltransferase